MASALWAVSSVLMRDGPDRDERAWGAFVPPLERWSRRRYHGVDNRSPCHPRSCVTDWCSSGFRWSSPPPVSPSPCPVLLGADWLARVTAPPTPPLPSEVEPPFGEIADPACVPP